MSGTELVLPDGTLVPVRDRRALTAERDPRAATKPTQFVSPTLPQIEEWNARAAFRHGYLANVVAYRCVQVRANTGAAIPLVAGRRLGDAKSINPNAAITKLLGPPPGGPAPRLSARKLLRWTFAQQIVTGRRAWEIETANDKEDGRPVAFWPLAAESLHAYPSRSGNDWFRLFEYGPRHDPVRLAPGLVFYGWEPSGSDFRQAESPLQASRYDLSLITLCDRYQIGFLRNNAVPAAVITTTAFPDEETKQRFQQSWSHEYQGPDNAGRVAFREVESDDGGGSVAETIHIETLGLSAKDSRIVETRKAAMSEVAISLGVPWSKLDASGRTFDNAKVEDRAFWEETMLPDLVELQDDINMQLAPRLGNEVVWFDLRGVRALRPEKRFVQINVTEMLDRGVVVPNEVRDDVDLEPVEGGDEPIERPALPSPSMAQPETEDEPGDGTPPALPERKPPAPVRAPTPLTPPDPVELPAVAENRAVDPEAVEARRAGAWRATDAAATTVEGRWIRALRRLFARQADATLSRLTGKRGRQAMQRAPGDPVDDVDVNSIFDALFWTAATAEMALDLYEQAAVAGLDRLVATFGIAFDIEAPWVAEYIASRANQLAGQVTTTTYEAIQGQLVAGIEAGESIDDLAERIRQVFTQASETRAVTIARTEVISAYNGATVAGAEQLPRDVVAAMEWIATRDARTRDTHASADGQVVGVGQPFTVGGYSAAHPGDPALPAEETVNCRCAVLALTPEEFEALERGPRLVDVRHAKALLGLAGPDLDLIAFRRALETAA